MGKIISLGVDPSFTGTGIVLLEEGVLINDSVVRTDPKDTIVKRVAKMIHYVDIAVNKALSHRLEDDELIITIEGFSFNSKGKSVFQIGYLGWRLREYLDSLSPKLKITWIEVPPNNLKLYATGKGNCAKELILQQVYKRWDEEFDDNNLADAFVLAKMGHSYLAGNSSLTDFQIRSMDAVRDVNKK